jgi:hypothetical protein
MLIPHLPSAHLQRAKEWQAILKLRLAISELYSPGDQYRDAIYHYSI